MTLGSMAPHFQNVGGNEDSSAGTELAAVPSVRTSVVADDSEAFPHESNIAETGHSWRGTIAPFRTDQHVGIRCMDVASGEDSDRHYRPTARSVGKVFLRNNNDVLCH